jgi:hypothetical protein
MSYLEKTNMPQLEKDIEDFTAFAKKELSKGVTFSIDELYDRWGKAIPLPRMRSPCKPRFEIWRMERAVDLSISSLLLLLNGTTSRTIDEFQSTNSSSRREGCAAYL